MLIPLLNSSTNALLLYLLFLIVLLNFYTNSFIVFLYCSTLLSLATLTTSLSLLSNFFLNPNKNFFNNSNFTFSVSKFSRIFFFYISADPLSIYNSIYCICFSIAALLIFILKYNLHTIINFPIFFASPINTGLATFILDFVLGLFAISFFSIATLLLITPTTTK